MVEVKLGKYVHSKSKKIYEVIGICRHSETLEQLVMYKALYDSKEFGNNSIWVRSKKMFLEEIKINGKIVPRFKFIV